MEFLAILSAVGLKRENSFLIRVDPTRITPLIKGSNQIETKAVSLCNKISAECSVSLSANCHKAEPYVKTHCKVYAHPNSYILVAGETNLLEKHESFPI